MTIRGVDRHVAALLAMTIRSVHCPTTQARLLRALAMTKRVELVLMGLVSADRCECLTVGSPRRDRYRWIGA